MLHDGNVALSVLSSLWDSFYVIVFIALFAAFLVSTYRILQQESAYAEKE